MSLKYKALKNILFQDPALLLSSHPLSGVVPRFKEMAVQTDDVELGEMATQTNFNVAVVLSDASIYSNREP